MPALIEVPLDLPHVRVLHTRLDGRDLTVTVESATCLHCGERTSELILTGSQFGCVICPSWG